METLIKDCGRRIRWEDLVELYREKYRGYCVIWANKELIVLELTTA